MLLAQPAGRQCGIKFVGFPRALRKQIIEISKRAE
jgi:hypothetical protein